MKHSVKNVSIVSLLFILSVSGAYAQTGTPARESDAPAHPGPKATKAAEGDTWQCKNKPIPPGFEMVKEIDEPSCHDGRAYVIRRSEATPSAPTVRLEQPAAAADPSAQRDEIYGSARPVEIVDVAADQKGHVSKNLKITGQLTVSSHYGHGYRQAQSTHLAFTLKDSTGEAFVYVRRGNFGDELREQILQADNRLVRGTFVIRLNPDRYETSSELYADLILVDPAKK